MISIVIFDTFDYLLKRKLVPFKFGGPVKELWTLNLEQSEYWVQFPYSAMLFIRYYSIMSEVILLLCQVMGEVILLCQVDSLFDLPIF